MHYVIIFKKNLWKEIVKYHISVFIIQLNQMFQGNCFHCLLNLHSILNFSSIVLVSVPILYNLKTSPLHEAEVCSPVHMTYLFHFHHFRGDHKKQLGKKEKTKRNEAMMK